MSGKFAALTFISFVSLGGMALADLRGPAEAPPAGFKGQQYVDSRGCVFLRAGHGGKVEWVPRISRDRKQLCGPSPGAAAKNVQQNTTRAADAAVPAQKSAATQLPVEKHITPNRPTAQMRPQMAPVKPAPPVQVALPPVAAPKQRVATKPNSAPSVPAAGTKLGYVAVQPQAEPSAPVAAVRARVPAPTAALPSGSGYQLGCPDHVPNPRSFSTNSGGSVVLCTGADGSMTHAQFPQLVTGALSVPQRKSNLSGYVEATGQYRAVADNVNPAPPPGYKMAWDDDRLNINRGPRHEMGQLDQDTVWTREVPARLHSDVPPRIKKFAGSSEDDPQFWSQKAGSTRPPADATNAAIPSQPPVAQPKAAPVVQARGHVNSQPQRDVSGQLLVQVGSFAMPQNADKTAKLLEKKGLPVIRRSARGGKWDVVYAGPFATTEAAQAALTYAKSAGFKDAILAR